ncbi:methyltransferase involved in williams-beuren syndrome [Holotrichia oblita]|uniref:Methyltransferase involved in williams-beuren syndrome n=1 Tax=Holotrichia oblita TaxID=644536 RepID=A0ACB9SIW1_HOLOL|nr:methyltransferase involved in williams-beuren syndrome [Holotrichia oblita]
MTGGNMPLPKALGTNEDSNAVDYVSKRDRMKKMRGKPLKKSRDWIIEKKERRRRQGKDTRPDSKYTGRKRSGRF